MSGDPKKLSRGGSSRNRSFRTLLLFAVLFAFSCMLIDALIYIPSRGSAPPPPGVEERTITTSDDVRLHAFYAPPPEAGAPVILWSHGNAGNITMRADVLQILAARGLGVLAYDYRGYGASEGRPNEHGLYLDAEAAYDSLRADGISAERIVCYGESLGSGVSVELARRRPCAALVLLAPFTSLNDVARHHYGPLSRVIATRFPSLSRIGELRLPLLVIHGDLDEVVPFPLGERLFAAANEPKRFVRVPGAYHNDLFDHPIVIDAIADFALKPLRP